MAFAPGDDSFLSSGQDTNQFMLIVLYIGIYKESCNFCFFFFFLKKKVSCNIIYGKWRGYHLYKMMSKRSIGFFKGFNSFLI